MFTFRELAFRLLDPAYSCLPGCFCKQVRHVIEPRYGSANHGHAIHKDEGLLGGLPLFTTDARAVKIVANLGFETGVLGGNGPIHGF